ncbi:MAG TPA: MtnX-like HAD-IB family phosphatase [Candidatus Acidoferrum sp.]|nr:MtnX-like HAD-IB family phosphatase [Candidatus Acidoferrum sp.]
MNEANIRANTQLAEAIGLDNERWSILCDFDGTVSLVDVTDTLLSRFGMEGYQTLESAWAAGKIGSRECMGAQIALLDASKDELDSALDTIELDASFKAFVTLARKLGMPVKIVSDGLDYAIDRILRRHGLGDLPIYANKLTQVGERRWQLQFPHSDKDCVKASGNCKCALVSGCQRNSGRVLFVGDGGSDFCASGQADFVLAKLKLIEFCQQEDIDHLAIAGFEQALGFLNEHHAKAANEIV